MKCCPRHPGEQMYRGKKQWICRKCEKVYRDRYRKRVGYEARRAYHLLTTYGLTLEQYNERAAAQGGLCAICQRPPSGRHPLLVVDHDHSCCPSKNKTCGQCVRGLLCDGCNRMLGAVGDSPETLERAVKYLVRKVLCPDDVR
jgi:hypothetical protein